MDDMLPTLCFRKNFPTIQINLGVNRLRPMQNDFVWITGGSKLDGGFELLSLRQVHLGKFANMNMSN